ncbi:DegT/DnrJ/EryC1/StrS family aminotransferase [Paenibacillus sp. CN-4]|uniref:DegT/DnrJ/EryC1/StrS family aminotransferase n=1 Tax=Paenibacillus nanchangensis TaxID=3348343 RepID=UPI00397BF662
MKYIQEAFDTNWIAPLGTNVDMFEKELCEYVGVDYGLALSSGTSGIHLALKYFGVGPGDYVFCSDLTFAGSCNPILYEHATPIFIDSEPETWNMSPIALEEAFEWAVRENKMPKAIIIVDLYGQSADYDKLLPICNRYGVPVIEDAAEALGATYKGRKCGTFGDVAVFSFNGNKIITTSGGGMVVSNNKDAINKMRFWSTQSREVARHYEHKEIGYNYRMSNICAGIGRGQLECLNARIESKNQVYSFYKKSFETLPIELMPILADGSPNYWLSVITVNEGYSITPEHIIDSLEKNNIEARPVWKPMHAQELFSNSIVFNHHKLLHGNVGLELFSKGVCLPSGSSLRSSDIEHIVQIVKQIF